MPNAASKFLTILLLACASALPSQAAEPLAGHYYRGDGTGYNVYLDLEASGFYSATWRGCLGVYGTAAGHWAVEGKRLTLVPDQETGMMKNHLRTLRLITRKGEPFFVPTEDLRKDYYREYGPDKYSAFHKQAEPISSR